MPGRDWLLAMLLLGACLLPVQADPLFRVAGSSMVPTLRPGDVIRVDEDYFTQNPLERGALVAIGLRTRAVPMVKRVVAVAGDTVRVNDGRIVVGQFSYPVPARGARVLALQLRRYGGRVPAGQFIALGDNPQASFDSAGFGLLSRQQLLGRVQAVVAE